MHRNLRVGQDVVVAPLCCVRSESLLTGGTGTGSLDRTEFNKANMLSDGQRRPRQCACVYVYMYVVWGILFVCLFELAKTNRT